jgi:hypothetical protein
MTEAKRSTPCECPVAGFCERHQCQKTEHWHTLCRTRADYFDLWEQGRGPGQYLPDGPGLLQRVGNFGKAVVRHIADRGRKVDDQIFEERLAICQDCPSCDVKRWICREKSCGCHLKTKARWASERCPLGKWQAHIEESSEEMPNPPP